MKASLKHSTDLNSEVSCMESLPALIRFLGHKNGWARHHARECLVAIGRPAVPALMRALKNRNEDIRWEAAKALSQIGDSRAAVALAGALRDENSGVRWLAAEGLIIMGQDALPALLRALIRQPDADWLRQGAHHIVHDLVKKKGFSEGVPLLAALEGPDPALAAPIEAERLLDAMQPKKPRTRQQTTHGTV